VRFLWDFVIGPIVVLLPERWRRRLPGGMDVDWRRAGTLSGIYELIVAVVGLGYWYMVEVPRRIGQIVDANVDGTVPVGMSDVQVNGAALSFFYMNPLTWLLFYFFFEGAVRLCGAAFTENVLGTFPLYLTERLVFWVSHPKEARVGKTVGETAMSIAASVKERAMVAALKDVPDELEYSKSGDEEWLQVSASRRKEDWVEPKIVRVDEIYYRLEQSWVGKGPRPFCYRLRRLEAGVPGRQVLLYKVEEED
jgi:hypothetical protein